MYANHTNLFAACVEEVNSLLDSVANRTHSDDNTLCVLCSVVVKELVVSAKLLVNLVKVHLCCSNSVVVILVTSLSVLEEDVAVLRRAAKYGTLRIECSLTEVCNVLHIDKVAQVLVIPCFNLLYFV